jgi:hypothetical protein
MKCLILAASCSTLVAALLMSLDVLFVDDHARTILQALHDVSTPAETFAFMLAFLYVFGALPAILIGAILRSLGRASPATLVLSPAVLFLATLIEVAVRMGDASLALECLPAMAAGGLTMFWILSRGQIAPPAEPAFE